MANLKELFEQLKGKTIFNITTEGGSEAAYPDDYSNQEMTIIFTDGSDMHINTEIDGEGNFDGSAIANLDISVTELEEKNYSKSILKKLWRKTGAGMYDCKKAYAINNCNFEKTVEYLMEHIPNKTI